jgi:hypothetical protein
MWQPWSRSTVSYCHAVCVTIDGVGIRYWIYWPNSELRVIRAPSPISTLYESLLQTFKSSPVCSVVARRVLVTDLNNGDSSASSAQALPYRTDSVHCLQHLSTDHAATPRFQQYLNCCIRIDCKGNVFTELLPRNGSRIFISRSLQSNGYAHL